MYFTSYNYITINEFQKYNIDSIKYNINKLILEFTNLKEITIKIDILNSIVGIGAYGLISKLYKLYHAINIFENFTINFKFNHKKIGLIYYKLIRFTDDNEIKSINQWLEIINISKSTMFYIFVDSKHWNRIENGNLKFLKNYPENMKLVYNINFHKSVDNIIIDDDLLYSCAFYDNYGFIEGVKYDSLNVVYNYNDFMKYSFICNNKLKYICIKNENQNLKPNIIYNTDYISLFEEIKYIPLIYKVQKFINEYTSKNLTTNEIEFINYIYEEKCKKFRFTLNRLIKMINIYKYTDNVDYNYMIDKLLINADIRDNILIKIKKWKYDNIFHFHDWHDISVYIKDIYNCNKMIN
jgi:hypothetical protein